MVPNNQDSTKDSALNIQIGGDHYKNYKIQPFDFIHYNNIPFAEGCIIKYICRYKNKGTPIEDLKKIKHYVDLLIEKEEAISDTSKKEDYVDWHTYLHNKLYGVESYRQDLINSKWSSNDD